MIRNESVSVEINSVIIYPNNVVMTRGIGKGYNTATISGTELAGNVGDSVLIVINTEPYNFIVNEKHFGKQGGVTFDCVGIPATLEDAQPSAEDFIYADSDALIESSRGSVVVVNNIPTIDFTGQTYSKTSTPMSRILDMVSVIGGEAYEIDGVLHLEPIATIPQTPTATTIQDSDVFDFSYSTRRAQSTKTKQVLTNPLTDDLYSDSQVTLSHDEDLGKGELYFNPSLSLNKPYTIVGVGARLPVTSEKIETFQVSNETSIVTVAGIDNIVYMTLDGQPVDPLDYTQYTGYNVIRFHTPVTGEIEIKYQTLSVTVYPVSTSRIVVTYECSRLDILLEVTEATYSGSCSVKVPKPITYEGGGIVNVSSGDDFTFIFAEAKGAPNLVQEKVQTLAGGGTLTIKYLYSTTDWVDKAFMNAITSAATTTIEAITGEVIYDSGLAEYVIFLDKPLASINDIYYGSQALTGYTYVGTGDVPYISFQASDYGKSVSISANINIVAITIPVIGVSHPVTILDVAGCGGISSSEIVHDADTLCSLPATFLVSVADAFDTDIDSVAGKLLTGDFGDLTVDSLGRVEVTVTTSGTFSINADAVESGGVITVNSVGVV